MLLEPRSRHPAAVPGAIHDGRAEMARDLFTTPESFSVLAQSPAADLAAVRDVICVPTYKRPDMLERTLRSLAAQQGGHDAAVIVVENEGQDRAGATRASLLLAEGLFKGLVIVEPRQGNCKAYNAAWRCALTRFPNLRYLLGIDDDEEAEPGWLYSYQRMAGIVPAGILAGPVRPVFENAARAWLGAHPVFRSHHARTGEVAMLYSSANYLIKREALETMGFPFLDESFDFTGGGDTDFFTRAKAKGLRFWWVHEAAMRETMPVRRTEFDWIVQRGIRNGAISAAIERKADPSAGGRLKVIGKSLALLAAALPRGLALGFRTGSAFIGLYHAEVAVGRLASEFGVSVEQYRKPEKN